MAGETYFGRKYVLTVGGKTFATDPELPPLDIQFNVSRTLSEITTGGQVSILGLSYETITPFLDLIPLGPGAARAKGLKVKLEAGYYNLGTMMIIDGYASNASISSPPEMWLHLTVDENNVNIPDKQQFGITKTDPPLPVTTVASALFSKFGKGFSDLTEEQIGQKVKVKAFGPAVYEFPDAIKAVTQLAKWKCQCVGSTVYAYDLLDSRSKLNPIIVTNETGLVSVTGITVKEATVSQFITPVNPVSDKLQLTSKLNPHANGRYKINKKNFRGHYYGPEWYTTYSCADRVS